ncbi:hypothetical protein [Streptomyces sp. NBC_00988]|uniref:hypothetical protein n=1 Tax=Streptomyces sp. NBC_00988 TaxID=2903704 RepID=UPI00386EDD6F
MADLQVDLRAGAAGAAELAAVQAQLRGTVRGEVGFDVTSRALTTMDASNYRRVPLGVVAPRDADDVAATLAACRWWHAAAARPSPARRRARAWSWTSPAT